MHHPIKIIMLLAVGGFAVGAFSGGDFRSFDFNNISFNKIEDLLNSKDLGPLADHMKEALAYIKEEVPKLIKLIQNPK